MLEKIVLVVAVILLISGCTGRAVTYDQDATIDFLATTDGGVDTTCRTTNKLHSAFPVWKTVTIGEYETVADISSALDESGIHVSASVERALENRWIASPKTAVDLVKVTLADLGLEYNATIAQIYDRAYELNLDLPPVEAGPVLRLDYTMDQPLGEVLFMGTESSNCPGSYPCNFRIARNEDGLWLTYESPLPDSNYLPYRWNIFRIPPLCLSPMRRY